MCIYIYVCVCDMIFYFKLIYNAKWYIMTYIMLDDGM